MVYTTEGLIFVAEEFSGGCDVVVVALLSRLNYDGLSPRWEN